MTARLPIILSAAMALCLAAEGKDNDRQLTVNAAAEPTDSIGHEACDSTALTLANLRLVELTCENGSLREALQTAIPFVEAGLTSSRGIIHSDLDKVDTEALKGYAEKLQRLSPYSDAVKEEAATMERFAEIADMYRECSGFDNKAYSVAAVEETESTLLEIYDAGKDGLLDEAQKSQIDSLYVKADNYRGAVEAFDSLIKAIDAETEQFRDNKNADKIAGQEIERVMGNSAESIDKIKQYRYTAHLLDLYINELKETPRSTTPAIRDAIGNMLTPIPSTGEETTN